MGRDEVEALLKAKFDAGEADTGLYDTGLEFVVMDVVDCKVTFQWFASSRTLDDVTAS